MEKYIPTYIKAEKFLIDKLGYSQIEVDAFNRQDPYQILRLYNTIRGIAKNVHDTSRFDQYWAMNP